MSLEMLTIGRYSAQEIRVLKCTRRLTTWACSGRPVSHSDDQSVVFSCQLVESLQLTWTLEGCQTKKVTGARYCPQLLSDGKKKKDLVPCSGKRAVSSSFTSDWYEVLTLETPSITVKHLTEDFTVSSARCFSSVCVERLSRTRVHTALSTSCYHRNDKNICVC